jgi:hypothetical protein
MMAGRSPTGCLTEQPRGLSPAALKRVRLFDMPVKKIIKPLNEERFLHDIPGLEFCDDVLPKAVRLAHLHPAYHRPGAGIPE